MLHNSYKTKTSNLISDFIEANPDHGFTAAELSAFLKANGVEVNKTTIYRNLDKLADSGRLIKQKSPVSDGYMYAAADTEHHCEEHIHFRCRECGAMLHLDDTQTADCLHTLSEHLGLDIDLTASTLSGICQKCKQNDTHSSGTSDSSSVGVSQ